jgi:F-type H+-transporting ATPase subunit epsilon
MRLTLLTPQRKILDGETIEELFVPGHRGQLDILEGHANLLTTLDPGIMKWKTGESWSSAVVTSGMLEVFNGHATIAADIVEFKSEINLARAKTAESKARKKLEEGGLDEAHFRKYDLKLQRALVRQMLAEGNA